MIRWVAAIHGSMPTGTGEPVTGMLEAAAMASTPFGTVDRAARSAAGVTLTARSAAKPNDRTAGNGRRAWSDACTTIKRRTGPFPLRRLGTPAGHYGSGPGAPRAGNNWVLEPIRRQCAGVLTASGVCWRRDGRTVVGPTPSFAPGRQVVVEVAVNQRPPDRLFRRPEHGARSLAHPLEAINPERYKHAS